MSTINKIVEHYGISKNHLMKVVYELNLKGYIEILRGKHGGMRLQLAPEEINIGVLVRDTERDITLADLLRSRRELARLLAVEYSASVADST